MQKRNRTARLTTGGVIGFWLGFAVAFLLLHLLLAPGRTLQDALEAELLQGHLAGGYQLKNPPLYEWLLWTVQLLCGPGPLSYLVLRYGLIAATGILFYFALLRTVTDPRLAAAFSMSLVLFYWFGWEAHHNVSHSLALFVAILAFWLVALAYVERRTAARALGLGLIIGLGIMAKWSFVLVIVSFGLALGLSHAGRRVFSDPRSLLIPLAAALPIIPFVWWLAGMDPTVIALHSTRGGSLRGMLKSEANLVLSIPLLFLPWALVVLALAARFRHADKAQETPLAEIRLALVTAAIAAALMAVVVALTGSGTVGWLTATNFAIRYLTPLCLLAALGIAGAVAARVDRERFATVLALISVAVSLVIFVVKLASLVIVPTGGEAAGLIPFARLADELTKRGLGSAQFVTYSPRDAGNLTIYMPGARALSLSARIEPPPPDPIAGRPCVLLWSELDEVQRPGKPKRTVANSFLALLGVTADEKAIEDVVVDWGKPLIGVERRSVWHLLRGSGAEQACKRVAVRGVL